jgi:hypothetical protein
MGLRQGRRSSHLGLPLPGTNLGFPTFDSLVYLGCHAINYRDYAQRGDVYQIIRDASNNAVVQRLKPAWTLEPLG